MKLSEDFGISFIQKSPNLSSTLPTLLTSLSSIENLNEKRMKVIDTLKSPVENLDYDWDFKTAQDLIEEKETLHWQEELFTQRLTAEKIAHEYSRRLDFFTKTLASFQERLKSLTQKKASEEGRSEKILVWSQARAAYDKAEDLFSKTFKVFYVRLQKSHMLKRIALEESGAFSLQKEGLESTSENQDSDHQAKTSSSPSEADSRICKHFADSMNFSILQKASGKRESEESVPESESSSVTPLIEPLSKILASSSDSLVLSVICLSKFEHTFRDVLKGEEIEYTEDLVNCNSEEEDTLARILEDLEELKRLTQRLLSEGWEYLETFYIHMRIAETVSESLLTYGLKSEEMILVVKGSAYEKLRSVIKELEKELREGAEFDFKEIICKEI